MGFDVNSGGGGANLTYHVQNSLNLASALYPNANGTGTTNIAILQNVCYLAPFVLDSDYLATKIALRIGTASAGASMYIGIYELDEDLNPIGAPLIVSTALSATTTGVKTFTLGSAYQLLANKKYGMAVIMTGAVSIGVRGVYGFNWYGGSDNVVQTMATQSITPPVTSLPISFVPSGLSIEVAHVNLILFRN
jgi:hypothetical protein